MKSQSADLHAKNRFTRRDLLRLSTGGLVAALPATAILTNTLESFAAEPRVSDEQLLEEIERASFDFFWNEASPQTGQVKDRAIVTGGGKERMSSIAATGFGLSALCIADARGWRKSEEVAERVRKTLRFLWRDLPQVHGFYYHFIDVDSGQRWDKCELSSIDTSLLLCGVLTARQHFRDAEIQDLATKIYERVEWPWMLNGGSMFSMGWHPEKGFLDARWAHYCELMMIYLLAIGSPTHPVSADTWKAWKRPVMKYQGIEFISDADPLFVHQYSHAWYDFRKKRDAYADYFENSIKATKAHKLFCLSLREKYPDYTEGLWGITASDSAHGYTAWGGPPAHGDIDGSIVPCAAGGSLPFLFEDCVKVLHTIRNRYPKAWTRYSFVDAFNPLTNWYNRDVLGIDLGITMLMAENQRTGLIWNTFMKNPEAVAAMQKAGFKNY